MFVVEVLRYIDIVLLYASPTIEQTSPPAADTAGPMKQLAMRNSSKVVKEYWSLGGISKRRVQGLFTIIN